MPTVVHRVNWRTVTSQLLAVDVPPIVLCALISPRLQLTLLPTQPSQSSYCTSFSVGFWENECWRVYGGKCGVPDKGDCKYLIIMMMVVKARINFLDMVFTEVANYLTLIKYIQPMSMSPFSGEKKNLFNGRAQLDLPGSSKCLPHHVKMHNVILIIFLLISFISFLHVLTLKPLCLLYI